jgi:hypothetical protein
MDSYKNVKTPGEKCKNLLIRCSIVNKYGCIIFDKYMNPKQDGFEFNPQGPRVHNIPRSWIENSMHVTTHFSTLRHILKNCIIIGHSTRNDIMVIQFFFFVLSSISKGFV